MWFSVGTAPVQKCLPDQVERVFCRQLCLQTLFQLSIALKTVSAIVTLPQYVNILFYNNLDLELIVKNVFIFNQCSSSSGEFQAVRFQVTL